MKCLEISGHFCPPSKSDQNLNLILYISFLRFCINSVLLEYEGNTNGIAIDTSLRIEKNHILICVLVDSPR